MDKGNQRESGGRKRYPEGTGNEGESKEWAGIFWTTSVSQREKVAAGEVKGKNERGWSYWGPSRPTPHPTSQPPLIPAHPPTTP